MKSSDQFKLHFSAHPPLLMDHSGKRQAAVAMIIRFDFNHPEVLLIERAKNENDPWSGHLAMPGGRIESIDKSPRQAAERETLEEIGVRLDDSDYLGQLSDMDADGIPMVISCFVYKYSSTNPFILDLKEVADAFWFPLYLMEDPSKTISIVGDIPNGRKFFPAIKIPGKSQPLWGITYKLLQNLGK